MTDGEVSTSGSDRDVRWTWYPSPSVQLFLWTSLAAFGTYFCMYAFRKPISVTEFTEDSVFHWTYKTVAITSQLIGYVLAKLLSIKYSSEVNPKHRARWIVSLLAVSELSLVAFAILPKPINVLALVFNGLPLGMVFGFVLGYLEGRRSTEAMAAVLCTSFILADGATKACGRWLLDLQISELWMPATVGASFTVPALFFVWMLTRVPQPSELDRRARSERTAMTPEDRKAFFVRYAGCLLPITFMFVLVTILRSVRSDFAPEIWKGLNVSTTPQLFGMTEFWVGIVVTLLNGLTMFWKDNREAIRVSLTICVAGLIVVLLSSALVQLSRISPFLFMTLLGIGLYLPYVAVHTTVFERFIAITRQRSNLAYLMCMADFAGYLGYILVLFSRGIWEEDGNFMNFMLPLIYITATVALICMTFTWLLLDLRQLPTVVEPHSSRTLT